MVALSKGNGLAAAASITPTHDVHHITGSSTTIDTINVPSPDFCGAVHFIMDSSTITFTSTGGNIGRAVTPVLNSVITFIYDPDAGKWFPNQ